MDRDEVRVEVCCQGDEMDRDEVQVQACCVRVQVCCQADWLTETNLTHQIRSTQFV